MTKPFSLRELLARVHAMLRRTTMLKGERPGGDGPETPVQEPPLRTGDLTIDPSGRQVLRGDTEVSLKPKEFDLLLFLARHPNQVFTREALLDRVWGYDFVGGTRTVDVHIRWLRSKLERDPANPAYLQTIFGVGYKLVPQGLTDGVSKGV
jgi:DNA-binding response OmpR family regulator